MSPDDLKTCPFCKEQIKAAAIKCRFCGEWLQEGPNIAAPPDVRQNEIGSAVRGTLPGLAPESAAKLASPRRTYLLVGIALLVGALAILALGLSSLSFSPSAVQQLSSFITKCGIVAGLIAFFSAKKGKRFLVFSVLCFAGATAFGVYVWATREEQRQVSRRLASNLQEVATQAATGATPQMKPIGDANFDRAAEQMNAFFRDLSDHLGRMEDEISQLKQENVFSREVLHQSDRIQAETQKRLRSKAILERYQKGVPAIIDSARKRLSSMPLAEDIKRGALAGFENGIRNSKFDQVFVVRSRIETAELDFLQFMQATFNDYQLSENKITFNTPLNRKRYGELVQAIKLANADAEAFQKRQLDSLEAAKIQARKLSD